MNRAAAALIPSSDVPDISPMTTSAISGRDHGRWSVGNNTPDHTAVFREQALGFTARHFLFLHHDRCLDAFVGPLEQRSRFFASYAAHLDHDPLAAIDELVVGCAQ